MGSVRAYIPSIEKPQDIIVMHKQTLPTAVSGIDALEHKIRLYKPENRLLFRGSTTKGHEVNEPHRHELYLLGDGESKVTWEIDTRVPNTAIFTFNKEDHTLGNLLTAHLHKYPFIVFAAYKVEHPLKPLFLLRVGTDGSISPKDAVLRCCHDIVNTLDKVSREFTKEMELFKIARGGDTGPSGPA